MPTQKQLGIDETINRHLERIDHATRWIRGPIVIFIGFILLIPYSFYLLYYRHVKKH